MSAKSVILVPTYNERESIERLLHAIFCQPVDPDVLFIDDNSPDGTGSFAEELAKNNPRVNVLHRPKKEGLGRAYISGFNWALERDYEIILMMDADCSHDTSVLPEFFEKIKEFDAVYGSRYKDGVRVCNWSFRRLLLSKTSNEFIRLMLNIESTDSTTAYKCFRRKVIEAVNVNKLRGKQNAFFIELVFKIARSGFRTTEIPFMFFERLSGESKMNPRVALESLLTTFRLFFLRLFRRS